MNEVVMAVGNENGEMAFKGALFINTVRYRPVVVMLVAALQAGGVSGL